MPHSDRKCRLPSPKNGTPPRLNRPAAASVTPRRHIRNGAAQIFFTTPTKKKLTNCA